MNLFKSNPNWIRYIIIGFAVTAVISLLISGLSDQGKPLESKPLSATTRVYDDDRIISLLPPNDGWVRLPPGTLEFGAALEFYGPTRDTWAIVYLLADSGWGLDEIVAARRELIREKTRKFTVSESRTMLAEQQIPVSNAKYLSRRRGVFPKMTWWVTTVDTGNLQIEVIAATSDENEVQAVEAFAHSLKLSEGSDER